MQKTKRNQPAAVIESHADAAAELAIIDEQRVDSRKSEKDSAARISNGSVQGVNSKKRPLGDITRNK